jgi:hypothetical protein
LGIVISCNQVLRNIGFKAREAKVADAAHELVIARSTWLAITVKCRPTSMVPGVIARQLLSTPRDGRRDGREGREGKSPGAS